MLLVLTLKLSHSSEYLGFESQLLVQQSDVVLERAVRELVNVILKHLQPDL